MDRVLAKLYEISERLAVVETKVSSISEDLAEVKAQDYIQNRLLDEHIAGVQTLQQLLAHEKRERVTQFDDLDQTVVALDQRVSVVELPRKIISYSRTALIWVGGIAGALAAIAKFIGLF